MSSQRFQRRDIEKRRRSFYHMATLVHILWIWRGDICGNELGNSRTTHRTVLTLPSLISVCLDQWQRTETSGCCKRKRHVQNWARSDNNRTRTIAKCYCQGRLSWRGAFGDSGVYIPFVKSQGQRWIIIYQITRRHIPEGGIFIAETTLLHVKYVVLFIY